MAIVLRSHLKPLQARLKKRGYGKGKLKDNIVSEALDYCGIKASRNYGRVFELEGTKAKVESSALAILSGKAKKAPSLDLSEELLSLGKGRYLS